MNSMKRISSPRSTRIRASGTTLARPAADGHHVELDRMESNPAGGVDSAKTCGNWSLWVMARNRRGSRLSRLMFRRRSPAAERVGVLGQQDSVGRHGQLVDPRHSGEHLDQANDAFADQRFAPVNRTRRNPEPGRHPHQPLDLLKAENGVVRLEGHARVRHAVEAPQVAAVGHRDPQIGVRPAERIDERIGGGHG